VADRRLSPFAISRTGSAIGFDVQQSDLAARNLLGGSGRPADGEDVLIPREDERLWLGSGCRRHRRRKEGSSDEAAQADFYARRDPTHILIAPSQMYGLLVSNLVNQETAEKLNRRQLRKQTG
jgi:hypothetical protein